jgi:hypothetical protein
MKERHIKIIRRLYFNFKKEIHEHRRALKKLGTLDEHVEILNKLEEIVKTEELNKSRFEALSRAVSIWEEEYNKYKVFLYAFFKYGSINRNKELIRESKEMLKELKLTYFS